MVPPPDPRLSRKGPTQNGLHDAEQSAKRNASTSPAGRLPSKRVNALSSYGVSTIPSRPQPASVNRDPRVRNNGGSGNTTPSDHRGAPVSANSIGREIDSGSAHSSRIDSPDISGNRSDDQNDRASRISTPQVPGEELRPSSDISVRRPTAPHGTKSTTTGHNSVVALSSNIQDCLIAFSEQTSTIAALTVSRNQAEAVLKRANAELENKQLAQFPSMWDLKIKKKNTSKETLDNIQSMLDRELSTQKKITGNLAALWNPAEVQPPTQASGKHTNLKVVSHEDFEALQLGCNKTQKELEAMQLRLELSTEVSQALNSKLDQVSKRLEGLSSTYQETIKSMQALDQKSDVLSRHMSQELETVQSSVREIMTDSKRATETKLRDIEDHVDKIAATQIGSMDATPSTQELGARLKQVEDDNGRSKELKPRVEILERRVSKVESSNGMASASRSSALEHSKLDAALGSATARLDAVEEKLNIHWETLDNFVHTYEEDQEKSERSLSEELRKSGAEILDVRRILDNTRTSLEQQSATVSEQIVDLRQSLQDCASKKSTGTAFRLLVGFHKKLAEFDQTLKAASMTDRTHNANAVFVPVVPAGPGEDIEDMERQRDYSREAPVIRDLNDRMVACQRTLAEHGQRYENLTTDTLAQQMLDQLPRFYPDPKVMTQNIDAIVREVQLLKHSAQLSKEERTRDEAVLKQGMEQLNNLSALITAMQGDYETLQGTVDVLIDSPS